MDAGEEKNENAAIEMDFADRRLEFPDLFCARPIDFAGFHRLDGRFLALGRHIAKHKRAKWRKIEIGAGANKPGSVTVASTRL